ncbi:MAG: NHL repeat-containing protein [Fidelibacterota bacterium]
MRSLDFKKLYLIIYFVLPVHPLNGIADGGERNLEIRYKAFFRIKGYGINNESQPSAISASPAGEIFITDKRGNKILKYSADGNLLYEIGGFGWGNGQFDSPSDIAVSMGLDIFVTDYNNHRIQRFDRELNFISLLNGENSTGEYMFEFPVSTAVSSTGEIFVVDGARQEVVMLNNEGQVIRKFGKLDYDEPPLKSPTRIEISSKDEIVVLDDEGNLIRVYNKFGNYLTTPGKDIFVKLAAIALDNEDNLIALDYGAMKLVVFEKFTRPLITYDLRQIKDLSMPVDISFSKNRIYLLDQNSPGVFIFERILYR